MCSRKEGQCQHRQQTEVFHLAAKAGAGPRGMRGSCSLLRRGTECEMHFEVWHEEQMYHSQVQFGSNHLDLLTKLFFLNDFQCIQKNVLRKKNQKKKLKKKQILLILKFMQHVLFIFRKKLNLFLNYEYLYKFKFL